MIRFPCHCGQVYEVPEDQAGNGFQCTRCGRLVDVPMLSDLKNLAADGTYGLDDKITDPHAAGVLEDMILAFTSDKLDVYGNEKDLRNTEADFSALGGPETLEPADDGGAEGEDPEHAGIHAGAPKYDPVTGELIRPLDVRATHRPTEAEAAVPVAKAMIAYARRRQEDKAFSASQILPDMFRATNMVVVFAIFLVHVFLQLMLIPVMVGLFLLVPAMMIVAGLIAAHYAVVVNDIATEDKDELPRPLRDFGWHDDLWGPFVHFSMAAFIAYGPLIAINWLPAKGVLLIAYSAAVIFWGTLIFPALFLTTTTSGHWVNLAPDRVLRVIRNLGVRYVLCVVLWAMALVSYAIGIGGTMFALVALFSMPGTMPGNPWVATAITYPLLLVGIFMTHLFCWYLGLQYRTYQSS
ncbi:MAG: hypothetical protein QOE14_3030, partial [Humisphaera sp.]|nr:hypothetical protein [Humisphaera sp.]